jgi:hypothetical protein
MTGDVGGRPQKPAKVDKVNTSDPVAGAVPGNRAAAMRTAVRFGVKYGPVAYQAVKHGKGPARDLAERMMTRSSTRRRARAHAASVLDGSVLRVFSGEDQVWVVFSGDEPVATHPPVDVPLPTLLHLADLTRRERPRDKGGGPAARLRALRRSR